MNVSRRSSFTIEQQKDVSVRLSFCIVLLAAVPLFGRNLLVNPGFESGPTGRLSAGVPGWNHWGSDGWHHDDASAVIGTKGMKLWWNSSGMWQDFRAAPGETFLCRLQAMDWSGDTAAITWDLQIEAEFYDSGNTRLSAVVMGYFDSAKESDDVWVNVGGYVKAPPQTDYGRIVIRLSDWQAGIGGAIYFDDVCVERVVDPDFNNDLKVDYGDFKTVSADWHKSGASCDLNDDGLINILDLAILAESWLSPVPPYPGYRLVWSDEFNGPNLNLHDWTYEIGTGTNGWGNGEWQYYTNRPENCRIENGCLIIEARKENYAGRHFTSARIKTQSKRSFRYGRIEARIQTPAGGEGIWPAFWMLGETITDVGWPACGELDIMEIMSNPAKAHGTLHYGSSNPYIHESNGGHDLSAGDLSQDFHLYAVEWDPRQIRWYRDDINFYSTSAWWTNTAAYPAPFDQPFFILLNFAVGSSWWNEDVTNSTVSFPQQLKVDYVRVYEKKPF